MKTYAVKDVTGLKAPAFPYKSIAKDDIVLQKTYEECRQNAFSEE
jgi:hypothetical protein